MNHNLTQKHYTGQFTISQQARQSPMSAPHTKPFTIKHYIVHADELGSHFETIINRRAHHQVPSHYSTILRAFYEGCGGTLTLRAYTSDAHYLFVCTLPFTITVRADRIRISGPV